jgi:hypothetical protein
LVLQDQRLQNIVEDLYGSDDGYDHSDSATKTKNGSTAKDKARDVDWALVAGKVSNGRKSAECMRRYNKIAGTRGAGQAGALKGPWTEDEDRKVISLVMTHGAKKWSQIAAELPGKDTCLLYSDHRVCTLKVSYTFPGITSHFFMLQVVLGSSAERGGTIT